MFAKTRDGLSVSFIRRSVAAKNPESAAKPNCLTRILVIDVRHDSQFENVVLGPVNLKRSQQLGLKTLESSADEFRRISEKEDVDVAVLLLDISHEREWPFGQPLLRMM